MKKKSRVALISIVCLEIILILVIYNWMKKDELYSESFTADQFEVSQDITDARVEDGSLIINRPDDTEKYDKPVDFAWGPGNKVPAGTYTVTIHYETDQGSNTYRIFGDTIEEISPEYFQDVHGFLTRENDTAVSRFQLEEGADDFEVRLYYTGIGSLTIHSIEFQENNILALQRTIGIVILLIVMNGVFLFRKKIYTFFQKENIVYSFLLIGLWVISCLILLKGDYYWGDDTNFHLTRIQGIKEALLSGQFPARIHPDFLKGYGYASATLYPELFLYIPALLCIAGLKLDTCYLCMIGIVNLLTIWSAFYSFKGIFRQRFVAVLGTAMYLFSTYRVYDVIVRAAIGEACAMIGFPLIAYGLYLLVSDSDDKDINIVPMVLGYTAVIQSHILSSIFVAGFSVLIGLLFIRKALQKNKLIYIGKVIMFTVLLNIWFIAPFLQYFKLGLNQFVGNISYSGLDIVDVVLDKQMGCFGTSIIACVMVIAFACLSWKDKRFQVLGWTSLGLGCLSILFTLKCFPWDNLAGIPVINKVVYSIQFPWRFLSMAMICFTLCACVGILYLSKYCNKKILISLILVATIGGYAGYSMNVMHTMEAEDWSFRSLNTTNVGLVGEYLIKGTDSDQYIKNGNIVTPSSDSVICSDLDKRGSNAEFHITSTSNQEEYVDVPYVMYPGYKAVSMDDKEQFAVSWGDNNVARVHIPAHYDGKIKFYFAGSWYYHYVEFISLGTLLLMLFYGYKRVYK